MFLTVEDCLKFPALRNCKVLAGKSGLSHIVNGASVLEIYDRIPLNLKPAVNNGELVLTSFYSIRNNVPLQCECVRQMYDSGDAALVIYYVGICLPEVHPALIQTADEVGLPLIIMPEHNTDCFYSDVLGQVYEMLFIKNRRNTNLRDNIGSLVSRLPETRKNLDTLLRLISDNLKCTVLLCDQSATHASISKWPASNSITAGDICELYQTRAAKNEYLVEAEFMGNPLRVFSVPFTASEYHGFSLYVVDELGLLSLNEVYSMIETLQFFSKLWDIDPNHVIGNPLIRYIIDGNSAKLKESGQSTLRYLNNILLITPQFEAKTAKEQQGILRSILAETVRYMDAFGGRAVTDVYHSHIICLTHCPEDYKEDAGLHTDFSSILAKLCNQFTFSFLYVGENIGDAYLYYQLYHSFRPYAAALFPLKHELTYSNLIFARHCCGILYERGEEYEMHQRVIRILSSEGADDLVKTLEVFYLDAGCEVKRASELMYLHRNTIQYRFKKIYALTHFRTGDILDSQFLSSAVACHRLLRSFDFLTHVDPHQAGYL